MMRITLVALLLLSLAIAAPVTDPPVWPESEPRPSQALVRSDLRMTNARIDELRAVDEVGYAKEIERMEREQEALLEQSRK